MCIRDRYYSLLASFGVYTGAFQFVLITLMSSGASMVTICLLYTSFYPSVHNPKQWFVARDHSVRRLIPYLTEDMPDIWLGAEVHYYDGIYRSEEILDFRIEDTELLLLEMPETKWTSRMQDIILRCV